MFLSELCDVLEVGRPEPAGAERGHNDYVFERAVRPRESDGSAAPKRIDLYKKDAFILEAITALEQLAADQQARLDRLRSRVRD